MAAFVTFFFRFLTVCGTIIAFGVKHIRSNVLIWYSYELNKNCKGNKVKENKNCKRKDIFQCVKYDLDIQIIGSVFTDCAFAMLGNNSGFFALLKQKIPHLQGTHCFLHRHVLASKTLPPKLKNVLDTSVKTINLIRDRALNHRLFKSLCQDFGSEHLVLLFHTEVRWLSRWRALTHLFELREEFKALLKERDYDLPKEIKSQEFNLTLAYLSDIFTRKNVSMQGKNINILKCREKLNAFKEKLHLWCRRVK